MCITPNLIVTTSESAEGVAAKREGWEPRTRIRLRNEGERGHVLTENRIFTRRWSLPAEEGGSVTHFTDVEQGWCAGCIKDVPKGYRIRVVGVSFGHAINRPPPPSRRLPDVEVCPPIAVRASPVLSNYETKLPQPVCMRTAQPLIYRRSTVATSATRRPPALPPIPESNTRTGTMA